MAIGRTKREVPKPTRIQRRPKDLRDEFAMASIGSATQEAFDMLSQGCKLYDASGENEITFAQYIALGAGEIADAMMVEREENHEAN